METVEPGQRHRETIHRIADDLVQLATIAQVHANAQQRHAPLPAHESRFRYSQFGVHVRIPVGDQYPDVRHSDSVSAAGAEDVGAHAPQRRVDVRRTVAIARRRDPAQDLVAAAVESAAEVELDVIHVAEGHERHPVQSVVYVEVRRQVDDEVDDRAEVTATDTSGRVDQIDEVTLTLTVCNFIEKNNKNLRTLDCVFMIV